MKHIKLFEQSSKFVENKIFEGKKGQRANKSAPVSDFIFDKFIYGYHKYTIREWVVAEPFYYFSKILIKIKNNLDNLDGSNLKDFVKISDFIEEYGTFKFKYADLGTDIWEISITFDNPEALKLFAENLDTNTKKDFLLDIDRWQMEKDVKKYNL